MGLQNPLIVYGYYYWQVGIMMCYYIVSQKKKKKKKTHNLCLAPVVLIIITTTTIIITTYLKLKTASDHDFSCFQLLTLSDTDVHFLPKRVSCGQHWFIRHIRVLNFFNVYLFLRERDRVQVGEGQRQRETQNLKQAPGSELSAQSLMWVLNSWTARSVPELKLDA